MHSKGKTAFRSAGDFLVAVPQVGHWREKIGLRFLQHLGVCSPQIGSTGSPPASSCSTPRETSTSMTTMTRLPWRRTARRRAPQVPPLFSVLFLLTVGKITWPCGRRPHLFLSLPSSSVPDARRTSCRRRQVPSSPVPSRSGASTSTSLLLLLLLLFTSSHLISSLSLSLCLPGLPAVFLSGAVRCPSPASASSVGRAAGPSSQTSLRRRGGRGGNVAARNLLDVHGQQKGGGH